MANKYSGLDIIIDKLPRSIENVVTGDSLPTEVSSIQTSDKGILKKEWLVI